jgi:chemosensory pili system protein ChpB (putative protein-glutamate methylesterase)
VAAADATERPCSLAMLRSERAAPDQLPSALERCGLRVVVQQTVSAFAADLRLHLTRVDVLLLDLERADDSELDLIERLLERVALPMIFHDGGARVHDQVWLQRLVGKIHEAAAASLSAGADETAPARPPQEPAGDTTQLRCWVLGASFGGPEALKRFLTAIPRPPPATVFLIGQHIGDGFVDVLAAQLNRTTAFIVAPATDGARLESGRIFVAPVHERIRIDAAATIRLQPESERPIYTPSIDRIMQEVASRFGRHSGAIVFSGMGDDGSRGSIAIARAGGTVWAQDTASSAIDSMPNSARATGAVRRNGSPEELAAALVKHLNATAATTSSRTA